MAYVLKGEEELYKALYLVIYEACLPNIPKECMYFSMGLLMNENLGHINSHYI